MGKFRRTLQRLRSAILGGEEKTGGLLRFPPPEPATESTKEHRIPNVKPLLDLGAITIAKLWKGLPPEIVDHIVFMLRDDLKSLKACSLTCKAMFISTRCVIHRKMFLTWERNWDSLTLPEKQRYTRGERHGVPVKVLSEISAYGLLSYARHLYIYLRGSFTPANLEPFNDHFQRFDRVQELSIYWLHTPDFLETFDTYFANFVPTLHSLHLDTPMGDARDILDFICRFPHLDDLTLKVPSGDPDGYIMWGSAQSPVVKKMPPFRGRLKLTNINERRGHLLRQLASLPGKRRFRFIDFRSCTSEVEQSIIDACSDTLETISTTWKKLYEKGLSLNLADVTNLRSLTLRVGPEDIGYLHEVLSQTLHTITSPFFSEFVLEVGRDPPKVLQPNNRTWTWGTWTELDKMFERLDIERGFRVVIRVENLDEEQNFFLAEERLPLMAARKGIVFEIRPFPEK